MHEIRIVNISRYVLKPNEVLIKVDRKTPVGNPFYLQYKHNKAERLYVIDCYKELFDKLVNKDITDYGVSKFYSFPIKRKEFLQYLDYILDTLKEHDVALGCWCHPEKCHAEIIKEYISEMANNDERR